MTEPFDQAHTTRCGWCRRELAGLGLRADAKCCTPSCRQKLHRFRVAPASATAEEPMTFGYGDPPYPGLARKYYGCAEVDHRELVAKLADGYRDGWALSTSAEALPDVLPLVREASRAAAVRVCPWVKGSRAGIAYRARNAWEPLIVVGGRPRRLDVAEALDDVLLYGGRQRSHPDALVGMKPAPFWEWLFRLLGAERGDAFVDLFPGSGAGARAWDMYTSPPVSQLPSRLEECQMRLAEQLDETAEASRGAWHSFESPSGGSNG